MPRLTTTRLATTLASALVLASAATAHAGVINWADWTGLTYGDNGAAAGTIDGNIGVAYSGEVGSPSQLDTGNTNYWNPALPYLSPTVDNAPGDNGMISIDGGKGIHQTFTFSSPVTDPVMALISVGQPGDPVHYFFDAPFTVLSSGTAYWGGAPGSLYQTDPTTMVGEEGSGVIQFHGTFTSIGFDVPDAEYWHGYTIGVPASGQSIPEPAALAGAPLAVMALRRRR